MAFDALPERLARVRAEIADRQARSGGRQSVMVMAVTKGHGPEAVHAAVAAGLTMVGENRVQEALRKQDEVGDVKVEWHLIGSLQRNKARHVVGRFAMVHSVDSPELASELDRRVTDGPQSVLLQVNCSGEPQKGGVEPGSLATLLDATDRSERLAVRGLMTMAAFDADEAEQRRTFALLRELRDRHARPGRMLEELSMGMSDDYGVAVEEGATIIRLGSALLGARA
ncbi:MAG TPA: YggS family pyridoxal phosphate-dependent enzyme [Gemmatimonadales bacterium]|nr:YggS family pyridoxal phosphate-dependent enzyme [Gemmatimonadales bacterium]